MGRWPRQINIVDYILDGRLGAVTTLQTSKPALRQQILSKPGSPRSGKASLVTKFAAHQPAILSGIIPKTRRIPSNYQIFSGPDNYSTPAKSFTLGTAQGFGFYLGVFGDTIIQKIRLTPTMNNPSQRSFKSIIPTLYPWLRKICALLIPIGDYPGHDSCRLPSIPFPNRPPCCCSVLVFGSCRN